MKTLSPLPSIYLSGSIAENQAGDADNVLAGSTSALVDQKREPTRDFKAANKLVKVFGLLPGSAERFAELR